MYVRHAAREQESCRVLQARTDFEGAPKPLHVMVTTHARAYRVTISRADDDPSRCSISAMH